MAYSITMLQCYGCLEKMLPGMKLHPDLFTRPHYVSLTLCRLQNLIKGYIARERGIVVLSKAGAFPGTNV